MHPAIKRQACILQPKPVYTSETLGYRQTDTLKHSASSLEPRCATIPDPLNTADSPEFPRNHPFLEESYGRTPARL